MSTNTRVILAVLFMTLSTCFMRLALIARSVTTEVSHCCKAVRA